MNNTTNAMTKVTIQEKEKILVDRIKRDYDEYTSELLTHGVEYVMRQSFETCWRGEIKMLFETHVFDEAVLDQLLEYEHPLTMLYREWLDTDATPECELIDMVNSLVAE